MGIRIKKEEEELAKAESTSDKLTSEAPGFSEAAKEGPTAKAPSATANFVNVKDFIEANKGKSGEFAGGVAKGVEEKGTKAQGTVDQEATDAQNVMRAETPIFNPGALNADSSLEDIQGLADSAVYDTSEQAIFNTPFVSTTGNEAVNSAMKTIDDTKTLGGLSDVTQDYYNTRGLRGTSGERDFDALLLGRDTQAQEKFNTLQTDPYNKLKGYVAGKGGEVKDFGSNLDTESKRVQGQVRGEAAQTEKDIQAILDAEVTRLNDIDAANVKAWTEKGYTPVTEAGTAIGGAGYITPGVAATREGVASANDIAKLNALLALQNPEGYTAYQQGPAYQASTFAGTEYDVEVARQADIDEGRKTEIREENRKNAIPGITTENLPPNPGEAQTPKPGTTNADGSGGVFDPATGQSNVDITGFNGPSTGEMAAGSTSELPPLFAPGTLGIPDPTPPPAPGPVFIKPSGQPIKLPPKPSGSPGSSYGKPSQPGGGYGGLGFSGGGSAIDGNFSSGSGPTWV